MTPIERGALQLYAGPTGDVAPLPFSFGAIDSMLAHHEGGDGDLGLVLLAIETMPRHGLRGLFDTRLVDREGNDLMHGCGLARHPRKASRAIIRIPGTEDHPVVTGREPLRFTISGRHAPGAVVEVKLSYAPRVPVGTLEIH